MPLGFSEIYCHLIWRVAADSERMNKATQKILERYLLQHGDDFGYKPLAVAVLEDHIHMLVKLMSGVAPGALVELLKKQIKIFLVEQMAVKSPPRWDDGYGIVSVSRAHLGVVADYIRTQGARHKSGKINKTLERTRA